MLGMNETVWVHDLNPFLVQFTESIGIRWYGLAYLAGFVLGAFLIHFIAKRGRGTLHPDLVTDFVTYMVLGVMIGGRLGYALFYSPDLLTDFSSQPPFWGVLRVWEGGMASHGGILGVFFATWLFAKRHNIDWRHSGDLVVLGGSVGFFFGRIANFINGELFGREAPASLPWAVKFPSEMYLWLKHDIDKRLSDASAGPDLLPKMTNAVKELGVNLDQWTGWVSQVRTSGSARAQIQGVIDQVIVAIQNGNDQVRVALGTELTPRHPSQLYACLLEGLLSFAIVFMFWRKPRKPGVVGALWLTVYSIVRIIGEQFRMPDAHLGFQLLGLTRGQWLSVGMLAGSLALLVILARRKTPVIAGWGREAQKLRDQDPMPHQGTPSTVQK
jgi:phosphatidylglycerol---prolipoprotein diacylglyceryl transferase